MVNSHFGQSLHATENISGQRLQVVVSQAPNEEKRKIDSHQVTGHLMSWSMEKPLCHNFGQKLDKQWLSYSLMRNISLPKCWLQGRNPVLYL